MSSTAAALTAAAAATVYASSAIYAYRTKTVSTAVSIGVGAADVTRSPQPPARPRGRPQKKRIFNFSSPTTMAQSPLAIRGPSDQTVEPDAENVPRRSGRERKKPEWFGDRE